jgi:DNA-binding GntR family transcriptional regulator
MTDKIDPTGKLPPYVQIAEIIADEIKSGTYPRGSKIPSETDLLERFEVARSTVRRSIRYLRDQGLIETVKTRGSYVL